MVKAPPQQAIEAAYERGWVEASCWANRDDLCADVGSPAYIADREPHLDALREAIAAPADADILKLAHRMAWRYTHSMQPDCIEYTFNNMTLLDFVRALKGLK